MADTPTPKTSTRMSGTRKVIKLNTARLEEPKGPGRPKKKEPPPIPQELYDSMTPLEREYFDAQVEGYLHDYPEMSVTDRMNLLQAAIEYVQLLRMQISLLKDGELLTQGRQHPGTSYRAWLDMMDCTRKARLKNTPKQQDEQDKFEEFWQKVAQ